MSDAGEPTNDRPTTTVWGHREHLDGLRTIAIYSVLLFHAGMSRFEGGFVGVDTFFVLSGFLVTSILLTEHTTTGTVNLRRFYSRRVRRLLPAAVVTVIGTGALSLLVQPRLLRVEYVDDARGALLYFANWHFISDATDYFARGVDESPFVHFWSLAIEEQFYFVFPLVLLALLAVAKRIGRHVVPVVVLVLFVGSLVLQITTARTDMLRAYYGTDTRLYQMLAGALLAWLFHRRRVRLAERAVAASVTLTRLAQVVGGLALVALIIVATDLIDLDPSARGITAMVCSVAVVAALELAPSGAVCALLSTAPLTYLGRISYSTYLWHWPLLVLMQPALDLSPWQRAVVAGVGATALAALSAHLLEQPIRVAPALHRRPITVVAAGLAISVVAAFVVVPQVLEVSARPALPETATPNTLPTTDDPELAAALAAPVPAGLDIRQAGLPDGLEDTLNACTVDDLDTCVLRRGAGMKVHLIGDSNVAMLAAPFVELAERHDFTLTVTASGGCPWQRGLLWEERPEFIDLLIKPCIARRATWYDTIVPAFDPDIIIATEVPRDQGSRDSNFFIPAEGELGDRTIEGVVAAATADSAAALTAGGATLVILEPLPFGFDDPNKCLAAATTAGACAYTAPQGPFPTEITGRALAYTNPSVFSVDYDHIACPFLPVCIPYLDDQPVFLDTLHLSASWLIQHADDIWALIVDSGAVPT